jgi:hypothetical protein
MSCESGVGTRLARLIGSLEVVSHLKRALEEFSHLGIDFVSLSESIDVNDDRLARHDYSKRRDCLRCRTGIRSRWHGLADLRCRVDHDNDPHEVGMGRGQLQAAPCWAAIRRARHRFSNTSLGLFQLSRNFLN